MVVLTRCALAEQFVGQQWLCAAPAFEDPQLFYWGREARNANGDVDFVISRGDAGVRDWFQNTAVRPINPVPDTQTSG